MIAVSQRAREHIRRLLADSGAPDGGLRIRATPEDDRPEQLRCELEIAERAGAHETVVETGGVRLFLDARTADLLDDAELVIEEGDLALAVLKAAGCAPG